MVESLYRVGVLPAPTSSIMSLAESLTPDDLQLIPIPANASLSAKAELLRQVHFVMGFVNHVPVELLDAISHVRLVQLFSSGFDGVNIADLISRGIPVASNGGANSIAVAEHTILLILAVLRQIFLLHRNLIEGNWQSSPPDVLELHELHGKQVGIIGMGRIGKQVAQRLIGFESITVYTDIRPLSAFREEVLIARRLPLTKLLETSDIITLHVPLTPQTKEMISFKEIDMMKTGAVLINTSRGDVVNQQALIRALQGGKLAGAGLDVFPNEPTNPTDTPRLPNIVYTPHRAGSSLESWNKRLMRAYENIHRVIDGYSPRWPITKLY